MMKNHSPQHLIVNHNSNTNMKAVIKKLNEGLKDPEYRQGWIANIAMAQLDSERWYREKHNKVGKHLNRKDRLAIANLGAEQFLQLLSLNHANPTQP